MNEHSWAKIREMQQSGQCDKTLVGCDGVNEDQMLGRSVEVRVHGLVVALLLSSQHFVGFSFAHGEL